MVALILELQTDGHGAGRGRGAAHRQRGADAAAVGCGRAAGRPGRQPARCCSARAWRQAALCTVLAFAGPPAAVLVLVALLGAGQCVNSATLAGDPAGDRGTRRPAARGRHEPGRDHDGRHRRTRAGWSARRAVRHSGAAAGRRGQFSRGRVWLPRCCTPGVRSSPVPPVPDAHMAAGRSCGATRCCGRCSSCSRCSC